MDDDSEHDLSRLGALIDLLRSKGVRSYVSDEHAASGWRSHVELEFEPTVVEHQPEKPGPDPDVCRCGHMAHEHQGGLCLRGCDADACALPEEQPR